MKPFNELIKELRDPQKLEELKTKLNKAPQSQPNKWAEIIERFKAKVEEQKNTD